MISAVLKLNPGLIVVNPVIVDLGVNESVAIMATGLALTSNCTTVCETSSVPLIVTGFAPVDNPELLPKDD